MSFQSPARPASNVRRTIRLISVTALGTLLSAAAVAQEATTPPRGGDDSAPLQAASGGRLQVSPSNAGLSLLEALDVALQENPEILAMAARLEAAAERPSQAHSLADPILTGIYKNVGFNSFTLGDEMMSVAGIRFTQPLPYKGKRDLKAATAERGVDVAASRVDLISRRVLREVAEAYFELAYVHRADEIVADTRAYLINLEQTAEARYAVGEGIQQDVLKAQVETSVLLNRLIVLDQQRDTAETSLNRLLNRVVYAPVERPAGIATPPWDFNLEELQSQAMDSSAIVRERARRVEQDRATLDFARSESKPDWILSGAYFNRGSLPDIWEVNVGITLPLYKGSKQDHAVAEAAATVRASELDVRDTSGVVAAAVRKQFLRAERASRLLRLYGEVIIPQATLSLESAAVGYEVGRVDFLTVLDNVVTLLTYQLEYYRQNADYLQALARIEEHVGHSLGVTPAVVLNRIQTPVVQLENIRLTPGGAR